MSGASLRSLASLLLDPRCAACDGELERLRGPLCAGCRRSLAAAARERCLACSLPLSGAAVCGECRRRPSRPLVAAPRPHEAVARELVLLLKAGGRPELAETLARETARDRLVAALLREAELLVPVPAHPLRREERGYDQAVLLAQELRRESRRLGGRPRVASLLARRAERSAQSERGGRARRQGLARSLRTRAFTARRVAGRRVLLVDDVVTTGASLRAASRLLRRAGAREVAAVAVTRTRRLR